MSRQSEMDIPTFETCPHCGRDVGHTLVHCDQYLFPVRGACPEHGEALPMRRVVVNGYPNPSVQDIGDESPAAAGLPGYLG